jgi:hypothetical protein
MGDHSGHRRHQVLGSMLTCHVDMSQGPFGFNVSLEDMAMDMGDSVCVFEKV